MTHTVTPDTALVAALARIKDAIGWRRVRQTVADEVATLAEGMSAGLLTPDAWQRQMAELLIAGHLAAAEEGNDGAISALQERRIVALVAEQVDYLNRFADQIEAGGWQPAYAARAESYLGAMDASYSIGASGALPLPAHPKDGSTPCLMHCDCSWRIRWVNRAKGDADCTWRLGAVEDHCNECKRRARDWAPLVIRGWEVQG